MVERSGVVTAHGEPLTLLGKELKVGEKAPEFTVLDNDMKAVSLADFSGKTVIISAVPSLDTPVCDLETRRFNEEASKLGENIVILTISMDLPFAQKRWCSAHGITQVKVLSDHREASFGIAYGVLIKELRLLARTIFVVDEKGIVTYIQRVPDITNEPNYDEVLSAAKKAAG
jgi:thiol peroxidase